MHVLNNIQAIQAITNKKINYTYILFILYIMHTIQHFVILPL